MFSGADSAGRTSWFVMADHAASAPTAFLSHASEDAAGFVQRGERAGPPGDQAMDDEWRDPPGDDLVQKLFDDGVAVADPVIGVVAA